MPNHPIPEVKEQTDVVKWHALDAKAVFERLDSGENGLDAAQAKQRMEKAGPNSLDVEAGVSPLRLLARQVNSPLIYLLLGAAVLSFVIGHRVDAGVIVGVVILNTVAFTTMAAFQWFQAFNARSTSQSVFSIGVFSNRPLLLGVGAAILLQLGAVHTWIGQRLFGTTGLSLTDWLLIVAVSSSIWVADEALKRLGIYGKPR